MKYAAIVEEYIEFFESDTSGVGKALLWFYGRFPRLQCFASCYIFSNSTLPLGAAICEANESELAVPVEYLCLYKRVAEEEIDDYEDDLQERKEFLARVEAHIAKNLTFHQKD